MSAEFAVWVCKHTVYTALLLAAPMLLAGLLVGLVISLLQAATQVHEMTLTFIPKILAVTTTLMLLLPWILNVLIKFTRDMFGYTATIIG